MRFHHDLVHCSEIIYANLFHQSKFISCRDSLHLPGKCQDAANLFALQLRNSKQKGASSSTANILRSEGGDDRGRGYITSRPVERTLTLTLTLEVGYRKQMQMEARGHHCLHSFAMTCTYGCHRPGNATVRCDVFILHSIACLWHVVTRHAVHVEVVKNRQFSLLLPSVVIHAAKKGDVARIACHESKY